MRLRLRYTAMVGIVAWSLIRAIPVAGGLSQYGVNVWIFLAIDLITVPPYVVGIEKLIVALRDPTTDLKLSSFWLVVIVLSFAAPYAYLYYAGGLTMPWLARVIIALAMALFAAVAVRGFLQKKNR